MKPTRQLINSSHGTIFYPPESSFSMRFTSLKEENGAVNLHWFQVVDERINLVVIKITMQLRTLSL